MESCSTVHNRNATVARTLVRRLRTALSARLASVVLAVLLSALPARTQQPNPQQTETPQGHPHATATEPGPCKLRRAGAAMTSAAARQAASAAGATLGPSSESALCLPLMDWYARFLNGPEVKPLTPAEKAKLAARNIADPFNLITIFGVAGISVAANSHSPYGPGMHGFARDVGVSLTQDITGEFFGVFLIPTLVHQDPHYHRMPNASVPRRVGHALAQIAWTQGDNGQGMVNYGDLGGFAIDDAIGNLYVLGQQTRLSASASRYGIALATAPVDNFITEFLPDLARHIHVHVVLIQRIVNQVAKTGGAGSP